MASNITVRINDNSAAILRDFDEKKRLFQELAGQEAVAQAQLRITSMGRVDTDRYRGSITYTTVGDTVCIGTNVYYAVYNEYGTGKFASNGNGRPGWWVYVINPNGGNTTPSSSRTIYTREQAAKIVAILRKKGLDAHMTQGLRPTHALRDAVADHAQEYEDILKLVMQS